MCDSDKAIFAVLNADPSRILKIENYSPVINLFPKSFKISSQLNFKVTLNVTEHRTRMNAR